MARLFVSHSSKDKALARRIAEDLTSAGHESWLDEWGIKVGECIVTGVQRGLAGSQFVVLLLSPDSVASGWVDREWKDAYWQEIQDKRIIILPALVAPCSVPRLLGSRKYADFTVRYETGLIQLAQALPPAAEKEMVALARAADKDREVLELLEYVQDRNNPVSAAIAKVLALSTRKGQSELVAWCKSELSGWDRASVQPGEMVYRSYEAFLSVAMINPQYMGWGGSATAMFTYMEAHPDQFVRRRIGVDEPVSRIEARVRPYDGKSYTSNTLRLGDVTPTAENPEAAVFSYARGDVFIAILENIRSEAVKRLLALVSVTPSPSPAG